MFTLNYSSIFLQTHVYWILFFVMIIEGPIISGLAGFAASLGIVNLYLVLLLSFLGGVIGDSGLYFIGRIGRKNLIDKYFHHKMKKMNIEKIEKSLENNYFKALLMIKVVPSFPIPGLILSGAGGLSFRKFIFASSVISVFYALVFTLGGYYFGAAFGQILIKDLKYLSIIVILIIAIVLAGIYNEVIYKIFKKITNWNGTK